MPGTYLSDSASQTSDRFTAPTFRLAAPGMDTYRVAWGGCSRPASGKANEDFYALMFPEGAQLGMFPEGAELGMFPERAQSGVLPEPAPSGRSEVVIALADGLSADGSARPTIEATVLGLVSDYYGTPAQWSVARALDRLLRAANDWIWAHNTRSRDRDGLTGAISVLVLHATRYSLAHVGDTRVYRLRRGLFTQLTVDHVWPRRDLRHVLRRALGLDSHLVVDFADGELEGGDVFLMVTDGVWEVLGDLRMVDILDRCRDPEATARALVAAAHDRQAAYMGRNDATAIVLRIEPV